MLHVTTDPAELDLPLIHAFLSRHSTWAAGIPRPLLERAIEHSLCFGGFVDGAQVAFARVVSDFATFAYLADVFVLPDHRGRGYGRTITRAAVTHPMLQGLRRFMLATSSAHGLYAEFGFTAPAHPGSLMERYAPDIYRDAAATAQATGLDGGSA